MAVNINVPSQVKTYANLAAFPATGALKTIYIAEDTNKTYRWTGSVYTEISASAAMTWGAIGGTLSNQTDLQSALDAKVPTSRTLTINGVTQDLSADRTFTISTGITIGSTAIASGVVGRVLFEGAGNVVQESSSLFWDATNNRLGIGTNTPATSIDTTGIIRVGGTFVYGDTNNQYLRLSNVHGTFLGYNTSNIAIVASSVRLIANGVEVLRAFQTGNVLIGTTTDAGFRLDVNGTARVTDLTIGTPSVDNNIRFGGNNTRIFNSITDNSLNYQSVFSASTVFRFTTNSSLPNANTSGTNVFMSLPIGFAPTSGTGTWSQLSLTPTINQTGGANGITRGIYINPTLTAAADFRAIETTNGKVIFGGLPTSSAGLPTGAIWNDAGTLKIV